MSRLPFDKLRLSLLGCGVLYAVLAFLAAASDYPTPERIASERLRKAYLVANALDKSIRPYEYEKKPDVNAQYEEFRKGLGERFTEAFEAAGLDRTYLADMENMESDRVKLWLFTGGSIVAVFALLHVVWMYARKKTASRPV